MRAETRETSGPHQSERWDTCHNGTPYRTRSSRGRAKPGHASPPDLLPELRSSRRGGNRSCERRNQVERTTESKSSESTSARRKRGRANRLPRDGNQVERIDGTRSFESTEPGRANRSNRDCDRTTAGQSTTLPTKIVSSRDPTNPQSSLNLWSQN